MAKIRKDKEEPIELTKDAFDELTKELEHRRDVLRQEIADLISEARELGDLSENHAYATAMEKKDLNEDRILELEEMLQNVKIVVGKVSTDLVLVGNSVEIENIENGSTKKVTLVGKEETQSADPREGKISIDSPIGKALFKARIGEVVEVELGDRVVKYKVKKFVK